MSKSKKHAPPRGVDGDLKLRVEALAAAEPEPAEEPEPPDDGGGESAQDMMDLFPARQMAVNDFIRAVGEFRLNIAQAELARAQALNQLARAQILFTVARQLAIDLDRVNRATVVAERRIALVAEKARRSLHLLSGRRIVNFHPATAAYRHFEKQALLEADEDLFAELTPRSPITAADFLDNRDPTKPCVEPADRDKANALALMNWTSSDGKTYLARSGSEPQRIFVSLFKSIGSVARQTIDSINEQLKEIRDGTFKVWDPIKILGGVEISPDQRSILENTGPNAIQRF